MTEGVSGFNKAAVDLERFKMEQDAVQHILSQTKANIQFLITAKALSQDQGNEIIAKLSPLPPPVNTATKPSLSSYLFKPRAVWGYNENSQASNDLTFYAGDIIEVTEETNANWWKGRINGKEGLFPCKFVERIANDNNPPPPMPERKKGAFNGGYQDYNSAPPPQHNHNHAPPFRAGLSSSKLWTTSVKPLSVSLAHSATGGLGFGAGSAVAGNLVNSLF
ncbi:SH3 domain-containing protein [Panaeolus papilionaceus]|nr:SH3 domain-containing protein [Panaeolus papilionaceus]